MFKDIRRILGFLGVVPPRSPRFLTLKIAFWPQVPRHPKTGFLKAKDSKAKQCKAMQSNAKQSKAMQRNAKQSNANQCKAM